MNILIAPDSFKHSISAVAVSDAIANGTCKVFPSANIKKIPLADGGEGTVDALVHATKGKSKEVEVHDPLYRKIKAIYGILGDGETAVIEMAAASGIELLKDDERNPWITTTYGTGELIVDALNNGCRRFIIGIGGSATNDGGIGMATALGVKFYNTQKKQLKGIGGELGNINTIDLTNLDNRILESEILVACDVNNPLHGENGAAYVYAPQKGADDNMVVKLNENLKHFGKVIRENLNKDIEKMPGAGAAGGLGAGLNAFLNAELQPGFEIIKNTLNLDETMHWADIVITGEGKIDSQTRFGKTPHGVAQVAKKFNKPVIAIAGTLGDGYDELYHHHFHSIFSIIDKPMALTDALKTAPALIENTMVSVMRLFEQGHKWQKKS